MSIDAVAAVVIGDLALIFVVSSLFGTAARRCGQPAIIGQIVAGLVLGPTVLGRLPGDPTSYLFPDDVLPFLTVLAQLPVVLFMFVVGYEVDSRLLRGGSRATALVATAALLVPMGLGAGATVLFHPQFVAVGQDNVGEHSFVLFMGVAMSITALPVLAAIVRERGLGGSPAGTVATTAAGIMDVTAWLVLAAALVGTGHAPGWSWAVTLVLFAGFVATMLLVVRPALRWWLRHAVPPPSSQLPVALGLALASAWVTSSLGLHAVFGALLAGIAMPRPGGTPDPAVLRPIEQCAALLLPLFFVTTGLSVDIGALNGNSGALLLLVLAIATLGKIVPAYAAARVGGLAAPESARVAVLVNTRGLTELVALNVALDAGIIGHELFTVLVLMALITTFMTSPLLSIVDQRQPHTAPRRPG